MYKHILLSDVVDYGVNADEEDREEVQDELALQGEHREAHGLGPPIIMCIYIYMFMFCCYCLRSLALFREPLSTWRW